MRTIALLLSYGLIHWVFNEWRTGTEAGRKFTNFLRKWETDWVNGLMVSVSVFILFCCGIVGAALIGEWAANG